MSPEVNMTTQEVNEYMEAVLSGKLKLDGLEATVAKRIGEISAEISRTEQFVNLVFNHSLENHFMVFLYVPIHLPVNSSSSK